MFLTEHTEFTERKQKEQSVGFIFFRKRKKIKPTSFSVLSVDSSEPCERVRDIRHSSAFSLIEVLVAMAVMIVIIVMVTNMFRDASEAWDMGTQRAEMNTAARAAIEYISRELSCAVAGSMPDSAGGAATPKPFILENGNELRFTAFPENEEALRGVRIRYDSANRIIETTREVGSYVSGWGTWSNAFLLITNVWRFEALVYENEDDMKTGTSKSIYDSSTHSDLLPAAIDISVEMLGERDMARALSLTPGAQQDGYVMTNSRVYTTRVCFPNRSGR